MKLSSIYVERLAESKQQSLQQKANLLIMRQLKRKLGELSPNLEKQIASLPLKTLEDLSEAEALLDFNSVDDVTNWLANI